LPEGLRTVLIKCFPEGRPMATGKITKRTVDAMTAAPKQQMLWDEDLSGFGLKVSPAGNKVYLVQYRMGGRGSPTRRYTIGTHGNPWTPAGAREEAERVLRLVRQGTDPVEQKAEGERKRKLASALAFDGYSKLFLDLYVRPEWKSSYGYAESILRLHVAPALRTKPLPSIRKSDLTALFDGLPRNQIALRRNVYSVVRRLFRWAKGRGDIEVNPLDDFEAPPAPRARDRVLQDWELRLAWLASEELGYPFAPFYRLLIGTGQRREEVSGLDWRELNRASAEWNLPATRSKNGLASVTHLSAPMIAELDGVAGGEKWPKRGLVFTTTGKTPVSGYSKGKARLDAEMLTLGRKEAEAAGETFEMAPWRVHDLRRTFATGMQRLGVRFEVTEAVLNHVSGSKSGVAGVYQRHDWKDEKKDALTAWAAHVERIVKGVEETNVVQLAQRA
jgi:integrase